MAVKVGTQDRKKVAIAGALGVVVLVLAARSIFGGPDTPPATTARAIPVSTLPSPSAASPRGPAAVAAGHGATNAAQLDPTLHPELMAENENFVYNGNGRNIFSLNSVPTSVARIEQPRGPIRPVQTAVYTPPPGPPPPPNIDLRFFGYSARRDGTRKAFLLHGDDVFIAAEGDVVSHRYRVVRIAPTSITVEDLPYHNSQSLPLVQN